MRSFIITVALLIAGVKFGSDYMRSSKFEAYADKSKAPWTCYFENGMGHFHMFVNNYYSANFRFSHTLDRCPDTPMAESALFYQGRCLEQLGARPEAVAAFLAYVEKYPGTKRAKIATRASEILRGQ